MSDSTAATEGAPATFVSSVDSSSSAAAMAIEPVLVGREQLPVELQPTFTAQDEQKERISMSIEDIYRVQSDLTGVTLHMSGLSKTASGSGSGGGVSVVVNAAEPTPAKQPPPPACTPPVQQLDDELDRLPTHQTAVYREAWTNHPHLVTDDIKRQFLDCEDGDVVLAAARLARHWKARIDVFGSERCFLPLTAGAGGGMRDEIEPMLRQGIDTVLPVTDETGRAIILIDTARRNFDSYSFNQEIRAVWYLIQCLAENESVRKRGVVFLMDGRNMQRSHYTKKIALMSHVIFECMPIRCRAFHVFPNWFVYYVLTPVIKRVIPKGLRMRLKFHHGSPDSVLRELESFNLPKSRLPVQLGGDVVTNMGQWVVERIALETVRGVDCDAAVSTPPPAKKARGGGQNGPNIMDSNATYAPAKVGSTASASASGTVKKRKGRRFGRRSDPRMAKAIEIKAANEDMSLHDALLAGGYTFRYSPEILDEVDEDGISLTQRKNNLCRRMRRRREQKENPGIK